MKQANKRLGVVFVSASIFLLMIILISFTLKGSFVQADGAPTPVPPLEGEAFTAVISSSHLNQTPIQITLNNDWTTIISETFEAALDVGWTQVDISTTDGGEYKWERETFSPSPTVGDSISAWAVAGGLNGSNLTVNSDGYPNNVDSWLIYGPMDLTNIGDISFTFDYWLETDGGDGLAVAVSTSDNDTANFTGEQVFITTSGWTSASYDLSSYIGQSSVYVAFNFTSDGSGNPGNLPGALIDNVEILAAGLDTIYLPSIRLDPTATPTATATAVPTNYRDDFTNDIDGWELRRADTQNNFDVYHGSGGYLNVVVEDVSDYIIVSPLVAAPPVPYSLEFEAQHVDPEERDVYGLVFGGDWDGSSCPNSSFSSCFETYYVLKVEYRPGNLRYKLQRINAHSSNQPSDVDNLIDWISVSGNEDAFNEWRVELEADNDIKIYFNDVRVGAVRDDDLPNFINPYSGVFVQTKEDHDKLRVRFDYFTFDAN